MKDGTLSDGEKKMLLDLARKVLLKGNKKGVLQEIQEQTIPEPLTLKRGCFVTLTLHGHLRGCIGYILPLYPLYQAVIDNAYNASQSDPRFERVTPAEVDEILLEISVLTVPKKLVYRDAQDFLDQLVPLRDGVILTQGARSSTFLPQVWEQLPDKEEFLTHLCYKAGLSGDSWKSGELEVELYEAEVFGEEPN